MGLAWSGLVWLGLAWSSLVLGALHVGQGLTGASRWLHGFAAGLDLTKFLPIICQGGCTQMD